METQAAPTIASGDAVSSGPESRSPSSYSRGRSIAAAILQIEVVAIFGAALLFKKFPDGTPWWGQLGSIVLASDPTTFFQAFATLTQFRRKE